MTDHVDRRKRSQIMRAVHQKSTGPEVAVHRLLRSSGYRFRRNVKTLPGSPDIVLAKHRAAVFVHGCFWHGHPRCPKARLPKTRVAYWRAKIESNKRRDRARIRDIRRAGWRVLIVWQCQLRKPATVGRRLLRFIGEP